MRVDQEPVARSQAVDELRARADATDARLTETAKSAAAAVAALDEKTAQRAAQMNDALSKQIATEEGARRRAVADLQQRAADISDAVHNEEAARLQDVAAVRRTIDQTREAATMALDAGVAKEADARRRMEADLRALVAAEANAAAAARKDAARAAEQTVRDEALRREEADRVLSARIDAAQLSLEHANEGMLRCVSAYHIV